MADTDSRPGTVIKSAALASTALSRLDTFLLADETWKKIETFHDEFRRFPGLFHAVTKGIREPSAIYQSATRPSDSLVFVDTETTNPGGDPLRVVIGYGATSNVGWVRSAYFSTAKSHGIEIRSAEDDKS